MAEGTPLLRAQISKGSRGFESHPLRHFPTCPETPEIDASESDLPLHALICTQPASIARCSRNPACAWRRLRSCRWLAPGRMLHDEGLGGRALPPDQDAGRLFTDVYRPRGDAVKDDPRVRRRLAALLRDVNSVPSLDFQGPITSRLGIDVPFAGYSWDWQSYFASQALEDVLNSVTVIFRHFVARGYPRAAGEWREGVTAIFDEQNTTYRIEESGGVRYRVDAAATAASTSTIATLNVAGFSHVAGLVDEATRSWDATPPDFAEGVRRIFFAGEELFKSNFPGSQRLAGFEIDARLLPVALAQSGDNRAADAATRKIVEAFKDWVGACHEFRHAKGEEEPKQPPDGLGILLVTTGMSWIRWLAPLTDR